MKHLLLSLLFLCCAFMNGQDTVNFKVYGSVQNQKDWTIIPNCKIFLKGSDGSLIQVKTDLRGNYEIKLKSEVDYDIFTSTDNTLTTPTARGGFLMSDDHGVFTTKGLSESQNFEKYFLLTPATCGPSFDPLVFKKNSSEYTVNYYNTQNKYDSSYRQPDHILLTAKKILDANSMITIELSGHCSRGEKHTSELSKQRAEKVKADLVKLGISGYRITTKGDGSKKFKILPREIRKAKTKQEKEVLDIINRRCVIKITSWEYTEIID